MIKKIIPLLIVFFAFSIFTMLIIFGYVPFMYVPSSTKIQIVDVMPIEYTEIKKDVLSVITNLNSPFDCEFDKKYWQENRDSGELICQDNTGSELYMGLYDNNISIIYSGGDSFWFPTNEKITNEHKTMQILFIKLASKYKYEYKKDVRVIFYHRDLPKEGRKLKLVDA